MKIACQSIGGIKTKRMDLILRDLRFADSQCVGRQACLEGEYRPCTPDRSNGNGSSYSHALGYENNSQANDLSYTQDFEGTIPTRKKAVTERKYIHCDANLRSDLQYSSSLYLPPKGKIRFDVTFSKQLRFSQLFLWDGYGWGTYKNHCSQESVNKQSCKRLRYSNPSVQECSQKNVNKLSLRRHMPDKGNISTKQAGLFCRFNSSSL